MTESETVWLVNSLRTARLTTHEIHVVTGIDMDVIQAIPYQAPNPETGAQLRTGAPGPDEGRDPAFVKAEARLDSPATLKAVTLLCHAVVWGFMLFMLAVFTDWHGWGRFIYS